MIEGLGTGWVGEWRRVEATTARDEYYAAAGLRKVSPQGGHLEGCGRVPVASELGHCSPPVAGVRTRKRTSNVLKEQDIAVF